MDRRLTESEIESITAKALSKNPHWEVDAWGLFGEVANAASAKTAKYIIKRLENMFEPTVPMTLTYEKWLDFKEELREP